MSQGDGRSGELIFVLYKTCTIYFLILCMTLINILKIKIAREFHFGMVKKFGE